VEGKWWQNTTHIYNGYIYIKNIYNEYIFIFCGLYYGNTLPSFENEMEQTSGLKKIRLGSNIDE
jgi:hypothetical protein